MVTTFSTTHQDAGSSFSDQRKRLYSRITSISLRSDDLKMNVETDRLIVRFTAMVEVRQNETDVNTTQDLRVSLKIFP